MTTQLIRIQIPIYNPKMGIKYKWENDFDIKTTIEEGIIKITANRAGLLSLANHLLNLAQENIPLGYHLHLDESNSLHEGSTELIIEKK